MARNTSAGSLSFSGGTVAAASEFTIAGIVRQTSNSANAYVLSDYSQSFGIRIQASTTLSLRYGGGTNMLPSANMPVPLNVWTLLAITKPTGTTTARFHIYRYDTDSWTRSDSATTFSTTLNTTTFQVLIGDFATGSAPFVGDIAVASLFTTGFSDAQVSQLPYSLAAWASYNPALHFVLDQSATAQTVVDLAGSGYKQSADTGTTVSTTSVPILNYGHPVLARTKQEFPGPTLVGSYFVKSSGAGTTPLVTPSFTPANGEILVVKMETYSTTVSMAASGGSQTYTSRVTRAPGGFRPWVGISTAVVSGSPGAMTVTATPSGSARYSMTVERWTNAQLAATPVTASADASSGSANATLTTTSANSIVSWLASDSQSLDPSTRAYLSSAVDEGVRDDHVGSNGVGYHAYQQAPTAGSQSFGLSAPSGMQYCIAGIEIQAAGGASGATANAGQAAAAADGQAAAVTLIATTGQADATADTYSATAVTVTATTATAGQADVAGDANTAVAAVSSTASASQADAGADAYSPGVSVAGTAMADIAQAAVDSYLAIPAVTVPADQADVSVSASNPAMSGTSSANAGGATVIVDAYNPTASTIPAVTAVAIEALVAVDGYAPGGTAVQSADVAAASADGFNPAASVVPSATAIAAVADVAADGQGANSQPALTSTAGLATAIIDGFARVAGAVSVAPAADAAVTVDANGAAASTSSNVVAGALDASVGTDCAAPAVAVVQVAADSVAGSDAFSAAAVTVATGTADAGTADVSADADAAVAQPNLSTAAASADVTADAIAAAVTTAASTTVSALEAEAAGQAFNALVQILGVAVAGCAEVACDALGVPKQRRPGMLTAGSVRSELSPSVATHPSLTAGVLRGPTYTGGG